MKKLFKNSICLLLILILGLQFVACGVENYKNTSVPTFTSITKIKIEREENFSGYKGYVYKCNGTDRSKYANQYINYLKNSCGFKEYEGFADLPSVTFLTNGQWGVMVDPYYESNAVYIVTFED